MSNNWFQFKQFTIRQDRCAMKVTTDSCLFGAWVAGEIVKEKVTARKLLDIGAGTALLSLMVSQQNTSTHIDAIEIDPEASGQAIDNINASPWKEYIHVSNADIRDFHSASGYDVIISNPPFYENELKSDNPQKNSAHHSHDLTLDELFQITRRQLHKEGTFYFLLPYKRKTEIETLLSRHSLFIQQEILVKQSVHHSFFRFMIRGGLQKSKEIKTTELSIRDQNQQYTTEFTTLLKDYYLYL